MLEPEDLVFTPSSPCARGDGYKCAHDRLPLDSCSRPVAGRRRPHDCSSKALASRRRGEVSELFGLSRLPHRLPMPTRSRARRAPRQRKDSKSRPLSAARRTEQRVFILANRDRCRRRAAAISSPMPANRRSHRHLSTLKSRATLAQP